MKPFFKYFNDTSKADKYDWYYKSKMRTNMVKFFVKHSKWSAIFISAFIASVISIVVRFSFLKLLQLDLLQVCDYPVISLIFFYVINIIRFSVRYKLELVLSNYGKLPMGPNVLDTDPSNLFETPKGLQQTFNMKTNGGNDSNSSNQPSRPAVSETGSLADNTSRAENNSISDRERENNRRIDNIVRGGPIGGNQGLPEGTIVRGNEATLPQGVRMDPIHDTTPNLSEIPNNNIHPSNNPGTRPLYAICAAQRPNWGDASNFPVGGRNGPFRIFDPNNQIRNGYNPNAVNQPALHNIGMAFNEQTFKANSAVTLTKDMFTPQQEKFILDHLQVVNPRLYVRLTGDSSMAGIRRTDIPWNTVTNNASFVRNFPSVNYSCPSR